jgi:hypothetical protein
MYSTTAIVKNLKANHLLYYHLILEMWLHLFIFFIYFKFIIERNWPDQLFWRLLTPWMLISPSNIRLPSIQKFQICSYHFIQFLILQFLYDFQRFCSLLVTHFHSLCQFLGNWKQNKINVKINFLRFLFSKEKISRACKHTD